MRRVSSSVRDAVLGDVDRPPDPLVREADRAAERLRIEFVTARRSSPRPRAGQSARRADEHAGIGLHADEIGLRRLLDPRPDRAGRSSLRRRLPSPTPCTSCIVSVRPTGKSPGPAFIAAIALACAVEHDRFARSNRREQQRREAVRAARLGTRASIASIARAAARRAGAVATSRWMFASLNVEA